MAQLTPLLLLSSVYTQILYLCNQGLSVATGPGREAALVTGHLALSASAPAPALLGRVVAG